MRLRLNEMIFNKCDEYKMKIRLYCAPLTFKKRVRGIDYID